MNRNQLQGGNTGNIQGWPEPCIYGVYTVFFGREITKYTVLYGAYIRYWPTLLMCSPALLCPSNPLTSEFFKDLGRP